MARILAAFLAFFAGPAFAAPTFQAGTTQELLDVCTTPRGHAAHAEAMQFCRGFALGVLSRQSRGCRLPSDWRGALAGYAAWVHANPIHLADGPGESLLAYLDRHGRCAG